MADKRLDQTTNASAVAAADNIPFVTAAGVTSYVTGDEMAASGPFSSRYVSKTEDDRLWIPAMNLRQTTGAPVMSQLGSTPVWVFDANTAQGVVASCLTPDFWASCHVDYWWTNAGAGAGDVVWYLSTNSYSDGDLLTQADTVRNGGTAYTAPASEVVEVTRVTSSAMSLTAGELLRLFVYRTATSGSDTLANECALLGVELVRAS